MKFRTTDLLMMVLNRQQSREKPVWGTPHICVQIKLHLHTHRETERHSEDKERLGKVCVLRNGVHHF
jgi:hypothetical protein